MPRLLAASALFAVGLLTVTGAAQPPGLPVGDGKTVPPTGEKAAPPPKAAEKKAADKKDEPVERLIEAALAADPDVKMARAEIALAEAKLAKARQGVAVKVTTLRATVQELRSAVASAADKIAHTEGMVKKGFMSAEQVQAEKDKLEAARLRLAGAEAELKLVAGDGPRAPGPAGGDTPAGELAAYQAYLGGHGTSVQQSRLLAALLAAQPHGGKATACNACHDTGKQPALLDQDWARCPAIVQEVARPVPAAPKGPVPDRLRAALDKPVSLGAKGTVVTFDQAVEAFRKVGLDVPIRVQNQLQPVESFGEELPVAAWLQLFADRTAGTKVLVREYGLLVTREGAPPDAVSVFDFWKQKPAAAPKAGDKPAFKATFRQGGATHDLPTDGPAGDALRDLARAVLREARTAKTTDPRSRPGVVERDHYQFVLPVAREYGLACDGPAVIRVEEAGPPAGGLAVYVTTDGETYARYAGFPRETSERLAKAFAAAGRPPADPKK